MLVRILEFENRIFGKPLEFSVRTICFKAAYFAVENPVPAEADFLFPVVIL